MKKMLCMLIALSLMFAAVTAFAATASKTITNTTTVQTVTAVEEETQEETLVIEIAENEEEVAKEIDSLYAFVSEEQKNVIEYFPAETQAEVAAMLPEGTDVTALECNEMITLRKLGVQETEGDVVVNFAFATAYKAEQKVVVLLGFYTGEVDAQGNSVVEWVPAEAVAQADGTLDVTLTQEMLAKFDSAKTVAMAVLSEKQ